MRKKSKQYWFNVLIYELSKAESIDGESKNLDEHLADWLKCSHDMVNSSTVCTSFFLPLFFAMSSNRQRLPFTF